MPEQLILFPEYPAPPARRPTPAPRFDLEGLLARLRWSEDPDVQALVAWVRRLHPDTAQL